MGKSRGGGGSSGKVTHDPDVMALFNKMSGKAPIDYTNKNDVWVAGLMGKNYDASRAFISDINLIKNGLNDSIEPPAIDASDWVLNGSWAYDENMVISHPQVPTTSGTNAGMWQVVEKMVPDGLYRIRVKVMYDKTTADYGALQVALRATNGADGVNAVTLPKVSGWHVFDLQYITDNNGVLTGEQPVIAFFPQDGDKYEFKGYVGCVEMHRLYTDASPYTELMPVNPDASIERITEKVALYDALVAGVDTLDTWQQYRTAATQDINALLNSKIISLQDAEAIGSAGLVEINNGVESRLNPVDLAAYKQFMSYTPIVYDGLDIVDILDLPAVEAIAVPALAPFTASDALVLSQTDVPAMSQEAIDAAVDANTAKREMDLYAALGRMAGLMAASNATEGSAFLIASAIVELEHFRGTGEFRASMELKKAEAEFSAKVEAMRQKGQALLQLTEANASAKMDERRLQMQAEMQAQQLEVENAKIKLQAALQRDMQAQQLDATLKLDTQKTDATLKIEYDKAAVSLDADQKKVAYQGKLQSRMQAQQLSVQELMQKRQIMVAAVSQASEELMKMLSATTELNKNRIMMQAENEKFRLMAKQEQLANAIDFTRQDATWGLEMTAYLNTFMAAPGGGTSVPNKQGSSAMGAIGGAFGGAAMGLAATGGNPIGAILGGIGGLLSG